MMVLADVLPATARRIRMSAGLMVQVVAMALLGPAPAVAIGVVSTVIETITNRVPFRHGFASVLVFTFLGLTGGSRSTSFVRVSGWSTATRRTRCWSYPPMWPLRC